MHAYRSIKKNRTKRLSVYRFSEKWIIFMKNWFCSFMIYENNDSGHWRMEEGGGGGVKVCHPSNLLYQRFAEK